MKKNKKLLLSILLGASLLGAIGLTACDDGESSSLETSSVESSVETPEKATLELSATSQEVVLGDEFLLVASYQKEQNKKLVWSSSDASIVTVNEDGVVSTHGSGKATITATYGTLTASCEVNVGFGDLQPRLVMKHLADGEITVLVGEEYALEGVVSFNGKEYPCDLEVTCTGDVVSYANGKLDAVSIGEEVVSVSTKWQGFDTALLTQSFSVNVLRNLSMTSFISYDGETQVATDDVSLSIVNTWAGGTYNKTAQLSFFVYENEEKKAISADNVQVVEGADYVDYTAGVLTALDVGQSVIEATYETDGTSYTKRFVVDVYCPIVDYTEYFEYDVSDYFPVTDIFGDGASVIQGKQGDTTLRWRSRKFNGVVANGLDTEAIEVYTTVGGYRFTNLYAYNCKLTSSNFVSQLTLGSEMLTGYYVLGEDVTVDMTSQKAGSASVGFGATFDGNGYTVNATVSDKGVFGQLTDNALIRNTHFNFTFVAGNGGIATGLAKNEYVYVMEKNLSVKDDRVDIHLENLYVTSTNYLEKAYTLMKEMPYFLTMKDIYVNVNVGDNFVYEGAGTERAVLFHVDKGPYNVVDGSLFRLTAFKNVHVVSGAFIAIADSVNNTQPFVTYAYNDVQTIKAQHKSDNAMASSHVVLQPSSEAVKDESYEKYYSQDKSGSYTVYTYNNLFRYNTVNDLIGAGVENIGSWIVQS